MTDRLSDRSTADRSTADRSTADREALASAWLSLKEARDAVQRLQSAEFGAAQARDDTLPWSATVAALEEIGMRLAQAELDARKALKISLQGEPEETFT